jgi:hypothetical protein
MEQDRPDEVIPASRDASCEWPKLVLKLRWIGLEDEARRLQRALSTVPPEDRGTVSIGPFSTD